MGRLLNDTTAATNKVCNVLSIDLSNPDLHQSAALLKQAGMDCGTFYVINHGVTEELMNEAFAQNKKFFGMPMDEKMKLARKNINDYGGYNAANQQYSAETYTQVIRELEDDPTSVWPSEDILPGWKVTMEKYQREALKVGRAVARLIALALDVDMDFFNRPDMLGVGTSYMCNILHYTVDESNPSKLRFGGLDHTDFSLFTLLATDDVLGLQICKDRDAKPQTWEYVLPKKGAFIVNIGDVLERLSNGNFKSILHNVAYRQERFSIAFFLLPSYDYVIECLPTQVSEENPPKYSPIKYIDYWKTRSFAAAVTKINEA